MVEEIEKSNLPFSDEGLLCTTSKYFVSKSKNFQQLAKIKR